MPSEQLATWLTGGVTAGDLPGEIGDQARRVFDPSDFIIAAAAQPPVHPRPQCWVYGGVNLNPMYWPARHKETLNTEAIYRFHPGFAARSSRCGSGGLDHDWGRRDDRGRRRHAGRQRGRARSGWASARRARRSGRSARPCSQAGAAEQVIGAGMPKLRAAMHLDTVFTFCDRDIVTHLRAGRRRRSRLILRPTAATAGRRRCEESARSFVDEVKDALGLDRAADRPDRRRHLRAGTPPVGRRQQRRRARAGRRGRLRPERGHQPAAVEGRHRGA